MNKISSFLFLIVAAFIVGAGLAIIDSNLTNLFVADVATWQVITTGGVLSTVSLAVLYFLPFVKSFGIGAPKE